MPSKAFRQIYKTKICEKLEWASIFEKFVGHAIYISENLRLEKTLESLIGRGFRGFPFKHYIYLQVYFLIHGFRYEEHRHSAIGFVTPAQRHAGLDIALLNRRVVVYEAAKDRHPERWSGATRNWQPVLVVHLNPEKPATEVVMKQEKNPELKKAA